MTLPEVAAAGVQEGAEVDGTATPAGLAGLAAAADGEFPAFRCSSLPCGRRVVDAAQTTAWRQLSQVATTGVSSIYISAANYAALCNH